MSDRTRGYALRYEIGASPTVVWDGLTDPARIALWYGPGARVTARAGGTFKLKPKPGMERQAHIDVFQAPNRLRLIYLPAVEMPALDGVIVDDFIIDTHGERTRICLLGSGFPRAFEYAEFFQFTQSHWSRSLARLKVECERRAEDVAAQ
jgi:uncharacterized protein YndB with AHSA1/START domain